MIAYANEFALDYIFRQVCNALFFVIIIAFVQDIEALHCDASNKKEMHVKR